MSTERRVDDFGAWIGLAGLSPNRRAMGVAWICAAQAVVDGSSLSVA